jgi:hypothetical protein
MYWFGDCDWIQSARLLCSAFQYPNVSLSSRFELASAAYLVGTRLRCQCLTTQAAPVRTEPSPCLVRRLFGIANLPARHLTSLSNPNVRGAGALSVEIKFREDGEGALGAPSGGCDVCDSRCSSPGHGFAQNPNQRCGKVRALARGNYREDAGVGRIWAPARVPCSNCRFG